jgi:hypothetical protein
VAGGWSLSGMVQFSSGQNFTVTSSSDTENVGCCNQERVDVVGNPKAGTIINTAGGKEWFDPTAFALPAAYTYGSEKVNPYTDQMRHDVDMSLLRQFHIGLGETRYFEFRADSFNLFNNVIFNGPNANISNYSANPVTNTFGVITSQQNSPRQLQMALKFYY